MQISTVNLVPPSPIRWGLLCCLLGLVLLPSQAHAQKLDGHPANPNPADLAAKQAVGNPNVLLIMIDDLNDWVGCLRGHPQASTPHIDALAKRGILFTNAHCNGPICNPSRVSLMTGIRPSTSGIYLNGHRFRSPQSRIRSSVTLPQHFASHGYHTLGAGKLFHASGGKENFAVYGPAGGQGPLPKQRLNCPPEQSRSKLWDWGVFPNEQGDASYHDVETTQWAEQQLKAELDSPDKPFLLAVGLYRPHVPFYAPQRFFDLHPRSEVRLPPTLESDREDIPEFALELTDNPLPPSHAWFASSGAWSHAIQSYLACTSFTDDNVGRLLNALDSSPHAENTWIVLLSDHGFFLGEKQRWAKQSLWERATRVPLILVPPKNSSHRFAIGTSCRKPVELISIFPTLVDVCQLGTHPPKSQLEGQSLLPLLLNSDADWPFFAVTTHDGDNHAVRSERYRYIRYADGSEELYDMESDPNEWTNLASDSALRSVMDELGNAIPKQVADPPKSSSKN